MIRLNSRIHDVIRYVPPFTVVLFFGNIDVTWTANEQIEKLMWIPATLVARFQFQFPHLCKESDELFAIGAAKVVEVVNRYEYPGDKIGAVCNVQCRRAMEDFANGLYSAVKICTTTRYENRKRGITTPSSRRLTENAATGDDMTELIVRDAAEALGLDLSTLTRREKNRLAKVLS